MLVAGMNFSLSACQSASVHTDVALSYDIQPGSSIKLNSSITIPAHTATTYIQGGKISSFKLVDQYYPHCALTVRHVKDRQKKIEKDNFIIYRIQWFEASKINPDYKFASLADSNGGISHFEYQTIMYLRSELQPDVLSLTCQYWGDPSESDHLTIDEIHQTLGELLTLKLK